MRIMSNTVITREEITQTLSEMDAKQNQQIKYLAYGMAASITLSLVSLVVAILS